jgi:hypothetical protein
VAARQVVHEFDAERFASPARRAVVLLGPDRRRVAGVGRGVAGLWSAGTSALLLIVINNQADDCASRLMKEARSVLDNAAMCRILGARTLHTIRHLQPW